MFRLIIQGNARGASKLKHGHSKAISRKRTLRLWENSGWQHPVDERATSRKKVKEFPVIMRHRFALIHCCSIKIANPKWKDLYLSWRWITSVIRCKSRVRSTYVVPNIPIIWYYYSLSLESLDYSRPIKRDTAKATWLTSWAYEREFLSAVAPADVLTATAKSDGLLANHQSQLLSLTTTHRCRPEQPAATRRNASIFWVQSRLLQVTGLLPFLPTTLYFPDMIPAISLMLKS